jgi:hypothetical protein
VKKSETSNPEHNPEASLKAGGRKLHPAALGPMKRNNMTSNDSETEI